MTSTRISEYRSNLSSFHDKVLQNHEPLLVTGSGRGDVIVIPADDFERLQETIKILKDRATMNSLIESRPGFLDDTDGSSADIGEVFTDVMDFKDK